MRMLGLTLLAVLLAGCETPTSPRYSIGPDANVALRSHSSTAVGVGRFDSRVDFTDATELKRLLDTGRVSPVSST